MPNDVAGLSLEYLISDKRRKKPSAAVDQVVGFAYDDGTGVKTVDGDEKDVLTALFDILHTGTSFFGVGLIDSIFRFIVIRAAVNNLRIPTSITTSISSHACVRDAQFMEYKRLCGGACSMITPAGVFGALKRPLGGTNDQASVYRELAGAMGLASKTARYSIQDSFKSDPEHIPTPSFPRIKTTRVPSDTGDAAFFLWITKPLASLPTDGPGGRGWGRSKLETALAKRYCPEVYRICGFSALINGIPTSFLGENESEAITKGTQWLERARLSSRLYINDIPSWRHFIAQRALASGSVLPSWLFGDEGKRWLHDAANALPAFGDTFETELLRFVLEKDAIVDCLGLMELAPPYWNGQTLCENDCNAYVAAAAGFIATSPYIPSLTASPV